jgi:hypothetical protein
MLTITPPEPARSIKAASNPFPFRRTSIS